MQCGNMSESGEEHMLTQTYHEAVWHYTEHDCAESNKYMCINKQGHRQGV